MNKGLAKRYKRERRFRAIGLAAIVASLTFLSVLFVSIAANGYTAFERTMIQLEIHLDPGQIDKEDLASANYLGLVRTSLKQTFPDVKKRRDKRKLYNLVSTGAATIFRNLWKETAMRSATPSIFGSRPMTMWTC